MVDNKQNHTIDPALEHLAAFNKVALGVSQDIQALRKKTIFNDGVFDVKTKALMAMICGINERCEPCLTYYVLERVVPLFWSITLTIDRINLID